MNETIIKVDRRGRLRYAAEHKQALIEAYQASGLSGPKFAELHGVPYQTLISWLKKRRTVSAGHPVLASLVPLWGQSSHSIILLDEVRCAGRVCAWLDHFDLFIRARCIM